MQRGRFDYEGGKSVNSMSCFVSIDNSVKHGKQHERYQ